MNANTKIEEWPIFSNARTMSDPDSPMAVALDGEPGFVTADGGVFCVEYSIWAKGWVLSKE